jgi:hypothetical protein
VVIDFVEPLDDVIHKVPPFRPDVDPRFTFGFVSEPTILLSVFQIPFHGTSFL